MTTSSVEYLELLSEIDLSRLSSVPSLDLLDASI